MKYELHPACAIWPPMPENEIVSLAVDIQANGLFEPITLTPDGLLLDGRNRAEACERSEIEPATVIYNGDPILFSLSKNKHRRHMSIDQIALVAATLVTTKHGMNRFVETSNEVSIAAAASAAGVSPTAIDSARTVLRDGTPEEITAVKTGKAKLRKTADKVRARKKPRAPKRETSKEFCLAYEATNGHLPTEIEVAAATGHSRGTAADVLRDLRARRSEADAPPAPPVKFTKAEERHIELAVARHKQELADSFSVAVRDGVEKALASRDADHEDLILKCRELIGRSSGRARPPFTNDEYKLVLAALHPDAQPGEHRTEAFVTFKKKELLLRSVDEKDFNKIRGIAPLPRSREEWEAARKATAARRKEA